MSFGASALTFVHVLISRRGILVLMVLAAKRFRAQPAGA